MKKLAYLGLCLLMACSSPDLKVKSISREGNEIKKEGKEIYYNGNDTTILKYNPGISYFHNLDSSIIRMIAISDNENNKHYNIYFGVDGINGINYFSNKKNIFYVNEDINDFLNNTFNENRTILNNDSLNKLFQEINDQYNLEKRLN